MTRPAPTPPSARRLMTALLLSAAGLSALAQAPAEAPASAPMAVASAVAPVPAVHHRPVHAPLAAQPGTSAFAPAPNWADLTPAQRSLLAPLATDWASLSAVQRSKWVNATPMLATLSEPELSRLHERMRDWSKLTPDERRDARIAYQFARQVDAERRQARWEAYQALPPEKRQELAEKAAARRKAQNTVHGHAAKPLAAMPKSNIVPPVPKLVTPVPVTGGLIQAKPGASTVLISRASRQPPSHQTAGEAKVVADPNLVDSKTLLPKSLKAPGASAPRP